MTAKQKQTGAQKNSDDVPAANSHSHAGPSRSPSTAGIITLLTDFGTADAYVGVMKGVIANICPQARIIDLCHEVKPQDVREAAFLLSGAFRYFPPGTIHLAVVDPTVGSERSALCAQSGPYFFVGPDNGVLSLACFRAGRPKIYVLENEEYFLHDRSRTFHGRDIFAPVAAHLASGLPVDALGRRVNSIERIKVARPFTTRGKLIVGRIVHTDRFGNLITNIGRTTVQKAFPKVSVKELVVECAGYRIRGLSETYTEVPSGEALALIGSSELVEVSIREGNASVLLKAGIDDRIRITAS